MTTVCTDGAATRRPAASAPRDVAPGRAFLVDFAVTLLVPGSGAAVLLAGWAVSSAAGLPAAVAAVAGWAVGVAVWLRRRGWSTGTVSAVVSAAPVAVPALLAAVGRLSGDGLVLWVPVSAVLAVALAMVREPQPKMG